MGLKDLTLPTRKVELSVGGEVALRGLTFADFMVLADEHGAELSAVFSGIVETGGGITNDAIKVGLKAVASKAPRAVAQAIALAADEPELVHVAERLPMSDQAVILEQVFELTFSSEAELKKLVEVVVRALTGVNSITVSLTS